MPRPGIREDEGNLCSRSFQDLGSGSGLDTDMLNETPAFSGLRVSPLFAAVALESWALSFLMAEGVREGVVRILAYQEG